MRHARADLGKKSSLRVIFDDVPDFSDEDIFAEDFINWQPSYDLYMLDDKVIVTIEIAGVDIKDFALYVKKMFMVIDGLRRSPVLLNQEYLVFHNLEIPYGRFNRRIDFPVPVESKKYQYNIEHGILTIKFPVVKERIIPIKEA